MMPYFKGKLIGSIHPFQVEQYKKARKEEGRTPATVNRDIACLRNMMNIAVEWKYLQINPIARVKLLKEDNEKMWVLSSEEEASLLEECEKRPKEYLRDLTEFALYSGMRQGEIFNLKKANVHLKESFVLVTDTKNHENRTVPLNYTLKSILKRRIKVSDSDYVFSNQDGKSLKELTKSFVKAVEETKLFTL